MALMKNICLTTIILFTGIFSFGQSNRNNESEITSFLDSLNQDDFSGTVLRVGSGVDRFRPGDEVVGLAPTAFRSHVIASARLVFQIPRGLTHEEAATMPTVFATAHHSICQVGRLKEGESILIHAAAGGVGLGAIQR